MTAARKLVGFYRERPHGMPTGSSLRLQIRAESQANETDIVNYLQSAQMICTSPGPGKDVLSVAEKLICSANIMSDGIWVWPLDLAYYVEHYHVALPDEFVARMRSFRWIAPKDDTSRFDMTTLKAYAVY